MTTCTSHPPNSFHMPLYSQGRSEERKFCSDFFLSVKQVWSLKPLFLICVKYAVNTYPAVQTESPIMPILMYFYLDLS